MENCNSVGVGCSAVMGYKAVRVDYLAVPQLLAWVSRVVDPDEQRVYEAEDLPLGAVLGAGTCPGAWFDPWGTFSPEEIGEVCWGASPSCNLKGVA